MIAVGIDPGVGHSHVAVVEDTGMFVARAYATLATDPQNALELPGNGWDLMSGWRDLELVNDDIFVAVETARGEVFKGRSADAVLQNNLIAGQLMGVFSTFYPVVTMPPSGQQLGFNWRDYLLETHKDADAALKLRLEALLTGEPLPTGARGGHNSHYADAAGIAVAALMRCRTKKITHPEDLGGFYELSGLEAAQKGGVKSRRAARKVSRAIGAKHGRL